MSDTLFSDAPTAPASRLGAELRNARLSLGWELGDLARSLRIRQAYLEAIEAGRISELPGSTYALGFVRTYASALGLPGEQVASRFRAESGEANIRPTLSFPAPVPQRGVPAGALMLLGLVVLAGAYSGWYYFSEHQRTPVETVPPIPDRLQPTQDKPPPSPQVASILPSAAPPAPAPAASPPPAQTSQPQQIAPSPSSGSPGPGLAAPRQAQPQAAMPAALPPAQTSQPQPPIAALAQAAAPPAADGAPPAASAPPGTRIVVKASADAWVSVKPKGGGAALLNKLMRAGDTWPVPADKANLVLTTGNAGGTEIDVDGTPIQGIGGSGMVRRDLPLDPDALKSGNFPPAGRPKAKAAPPPE
jgi:cytoskeleton protein RodZ